MDMKSVEHKSLELKVFAFSVDVVSFVKTFEKSGKKNVLVNKLPNYANNFYSDYLASEEALGEYDKNSLMAKSKANAKKCLELLQALDVERGLLNEKVDLIIEVAELIRMIES